MFFCVFVPYLPPGIDKFEKMRHVKKLEMNSQFQIENGLSPSTYVALILNHEKYDIEEIYITTKYMILLNIHLTLISILIGFLGLTSH